MEEKEVSTIEETAEMWATNQCVRKILSLVPKSEKKEVAKMLNVIMTNIASLVISGALQDHIGGNPVSIAKGSQILKKGEL